MASSFSGSRYADSQYSLPLYFCGPGVCDSVDRRGRGNAGRRQSLRGRADTEEDRKAQRTIRRTRISSSSSSRNGWRLGRKCSWVLSIKYVDMYGTGTGTGHRANRTKLPANLDFELNTSGVVPASQKVTTQRLLATGFGRRGVVRNRSCKGEQLFARDEAPMALGYGRFDRM